MRRLFAAVLALALCAPYAAHADDQSSDLISFGAGFMDFDKSEPKRQSTDLRLEYRFGESLLPLLSTSFSTKDDAQFHPFLGYEVTSRNAEYGVGGFVMDWDFCQHGIFSWSEGLGYFAHGDMSTLGSTFQFRSQAEIGYRFDNNMRLTTEFSHISDAKTTRYNPGAEILGMYLHVPTSVLFGR